MKIIENNVLFSDIEQILREGGSATIRIKGDSMRPFLRNGRDTVTLSMLPDSGMRRGMVLLFRCGDRWLLHRLRHIDGGTLTIKGDGNCRITERIQPTAVVGYASAIGRNGHTIAYGSAQWKLLTIYSLMFKVLRTAWYSINRPKK